MTFRLVKIAIAAILMTIAAHLGVARAQVRDESPVDDRGPAPSPDPPQSPPKRPAPKKSGALLDHTISREQTGFDDADPQLVARRLDGLRRHRGKTIRAISVESTGSKWPEKPRVRSVRVGEKLTAAAARRAIREVTRSRRIAQAYADARPIAGGVILRIVVVPRRLVAAISIVGDTLGRNRTLSAAELEVGSEVTEQSLVDAATKIRELHVENGYERAIVNVGTTETDDPMSVVVNIEVAAGEPREVTRRVFVIEPKFDALLGPLKQRYLIGAGDVIDENALVEADNEMAEDLRKSGFLGATVTHRVVQQRRYSFLYVYLDTGPRYHFSFGGNVHVDDEGLHTALGWASGTAEPNGNVLAGRLREDYRKRGYHDVRATVTEETRANGSVIEVHFDIVEGPQVVVTNRQFWCLPLEPPDGLGGPALAAEIDAILKEELPGLPLIHAPDEKVVDELLSPGGSRVPFRALSPKTVYHAASYDRVMKHLEELLNSRGYLNAQVGPVSVRRATCSPTSRAGRCNPLPQPALPLAKCGVDVARLPVEEPPLPPEHTCTIDKKRGTRCAPNVELIIPIQLGPQMTLYDAVFEGNRSLTSDKLLELIAFPLGTPFSELELDAAKARVAEEYKNRGYAYATVRTSIDESPDRTRVRARFIITERRPVVISDYDVRGAVRTDKATILRRLALCRDLATCADKDKRYRQDLVRLSEEQIATLGPFSSVAIGLEDPEVPQARKRVIITVVEQPSQYLEPRVGFSSGEGFRAAFEYGHRNVAGQAIALTVRLEFGFLPEGLILDDGVRSNYKDFTISERLERRNSISARIPEIGLGPKVDLTLDGIDVRDNQRDFGLTRQAVIPAMNFRPTRQIQLQLGLSVELNDVTLFNEGGVEGAIKNNPTLANLLRVPEGRTVAVAQLISGSYDARDNPLAATKGVFASAGIEHVSAFPANDDTDITSEFLRLQGRAATYFRLTDEGVAIALSLAGGYNLQLTPDSLTYPDRLFYLGGANNVRGFFQDSMVPEDIAQKVLSGDAQIADIGVRGGNFFINPRVEFRAPITELFGLGVFLDSGNVWSAYESVATFSDLFALRYTVGGGIRVSTPIGPIALDYGVKVIRREWEDLGALHFSIGIF